MRKIIYSRYDKDDKDKSIGVVAEDLNRKEREEVWKELKKLDAVFYKIDHSRISAAIKNMTLEGIEELKKQGWEY